MIESRIKEIASKHGIRSAYGLQKALDIAPSNASRLWSGDVTRFSVEILDKLCERFGVGVGDLLVYHGDARKSAKRKTVKGQSSKTDTQSSEAAWAQVDEARETAKEKKPKKEAAKE